MIQSYSKEDQTKNSPGGNRKSKAAKAEATKGQTFEKEVQAELQKTSKKPIRRNNQRGAGGGLSNSDISAMDGWSIEVKNTERLTIPEWLRTLKAETPTNKKPGLVFSFEAEPWITVRLKDRMNLASDLVEAAGGMVEFP